jgi:hypothetical protein
VLCQKEFYNLSEGEFQKGAFLNHDEGMLLPLGRERKMFERAHA